MKKKNWKKSNNPVYFNNLSGGNGKNSLQLFDSANNVDIRVDFVCQETNGSAYKTSFFRLMSYAEAILNDDYDAEIIVIRKGFIPETYINYLTKQIKKMRFCYFIIVDLNTSADEIKKLVKKQANKVHQDVIESKKYRQ